MKQVQSIYIILHNRCAYPTRSSVSRSLSKHPCPPTMVSIIISSFSTNSSFSFLNFLILFGRLCEKRHIRREVTSLWVMVVWVCTWMFYMCCAFSIHLYTLHTHTQPISLCLFYVKESTGSILEVVVTLVANTTTEPGSIDSMSPPTHCNICIC